MALTKTAFRDIRSTSTELSVGRRSRHRFQRRSGAASGFSLVEVVLAMGIVAFAFVPLLGLVPMGLSTSRQAIDTTIEAQITQQMTGQLQQTDFSALSALTGNTAYNFVGFDANGNVTTTPGAMIYKAGFGSPVSTALPGGATTTRLDTITIYILSIRDLGGMAATKASDLASNPASKKYIVFVADNGR